MKPAVRQYFPEFSERFEGRMLVMYCDIKGLVTTAIGNLIDPIDLALELPWRDRASSVPVDRTAIIEEWERVKRSPVGVSIAFWRATAQLVLTPADVDALVLSKLLQFERQLKARPAFAAFEAWPADAQLGLLSMTWAMGPGFQFPHFEAACLSGNWAAAANQCCMDDSHNPGLTPRNAANRLLFLNAATATDMATLYYSKTPAVGLA